MSKDTFDKAKEYFLVFLRVALAAFIFVYALLNFKRLSTLDVRAVVEAASTPLFAVLAVLGIYILKSFVFVVPASIVYIYTGMAFDFKYALAINFLGIFLEVVITFWLGKFLGGDYVSKKISGHKWTEKLEKIKDKNKILFLFAVRALPVFPIDFISLFLGASGIGFIVYLLISLAGIWPRVFLFTLLGDGIYDYIPMSFLVGIALSSIPLALLVWLYKYFKSKRASGD
ncbi:MAG TPA: VTT domain-containing protein [Clostridiales bacterium]|nr:VTT domain-containing protein [Clostridiales bacterium]HRT82563.1 VTT domain-containing protein [Oscillospiraceae bacterium]